MIGTATKKPVTINFCLWSGDNLDEVMRFCSGNATYELMFRGNSEIVIQTLEDGRDKIAQHVASKGDYIIQGVQGEFYPCKPDIFEATYLITTAPRPDAPTSQINQNNGDRALTVEFWIEQGHTPEQAQTEVAYRKVRSEVKQVFANPPGSPANPGSAPREDGHG